MATDFRYMKLGRGPGSTWFFVYNIPKELRGHPLFMTDQPPLSGPGGMLV